jgi:hypothetical protein
MALTNYSFDLMKSYPTERRYIIRKPLKTSFMDSVKELIVGKK